ncbi:MAG: substrate-binding domain-containing protein [Methanoregula sp.]
MNHDMAVSPIVATLVLIVVAVIGAVAVGTIMGTFSSDVSKQANAGQAASASQTQVLVAGSTTLQPAELNLQSDYQKLNPGVQLNVQGGGSGAGVVAVANGIADIGASSSASAITSAQAANPNDPNFQNLYYTMIGGRGVVWIQDASKVAVAGNVIDAADLNTAYLDASTNGGKTTAATTGADPIASGVTMLQREASSGTMSTAFGWAGSAMSANKTPGFSGITTEPGNAQMLAAVQAGTSAKPVIGFVDSGYAISGGILSNTSASGISLMGVSQDSITYVPTHANIEAALKDWVKGNSQTISTSNYPQKLTGGLYWITRGNSPTVSNAAGIITSSGSSSASSVVTNLINFAKAPTEATAYENAGMYSIYDFAPTS